MNQFVSLYVTCASADQAGIIARTLVEERLAACGNILPAITSIYRWEGKIKADFESALILKTRADLAGRAAARIRELHSYDTPCIVSWAIDAGDGDFLAWIARETADPTQGI